jgi:hypothetical protein
MSDGGEVTHGFAAGADAARARDDGAGDGDGGSQLHRDVGGARSHAQGLKAWV